MNEMEKKSILDMAMGAIKERVDYEMGKVITNILDPNTKATSKRRVVVTIDLVPDSKREGIHISATSTSKLVPTDPVETSLYVGTDAQGELIIAEMVPQIPGQQSLDGTEQQEAKILRII